MTQRVVKMEPNDKKGLTVIWGDCPFKCELYIDSDGIMRLTTTGTIISFRCKHGFEAITLPPTAKGEA